MNVYLVIFTDIWGVDYTASEAWTEKTKAEERCEQLNKKLKEAHHGQEWFYVVEEMPADKEIEMV